MKFRIVDLFNTKYFYVTTGKDLNHVLNAVCVLRKDSSIDFFAANEKIAQLFSCAKAGTPIEFDLAEARITSDVAVTIQLYAQKGLTFIDTNLPWRNIIFEEGRERLKLAQELTDLVPFPVYDFKTSAQEFIQSLSKNVMYTVSTSNIDVDVPLAILTTIYRPSVKLHIDNVLQPMFNLLADFITPYTLEQYDEFYVLEPEGLSIWRKGNPLHIQRLGYCSLEDALTTAIIVPTAFGRDRLNNDLVFREIANNCIMRLNNLKMSQAVQLSDII